MTVRCCLATLLMGLGVVARAQNPSFPPPTHLWAAQTSPTEITLSWRRVPGALQYRLYTLVGDSAQSIGWTQRSGDRFVRRVSEYGGAHRYAIDAVSENGTISERVRFNEVVPVRATPGAVAGPTSVAAEPIQTGVIAVRWSAVPDATGYMISRSVAPSGFRLLCGFCPAATTYMDSATTPGATHSYMVVALSPRGPSRPARSGAVVPQGTPVAATATTVPNATDRSSPPRGIIHATPRPGSCLALGAEGNFIVRLADGSVRIYERVQWRRQGPTFPKEPKLVAVPGISDAVAVATSGEHWLALRSDGTILSWGKTNADGRLGRDVWMGHGPREEGMAPPPETPAPVRDITNAVAIAAGAEHSVALLADSTIRVWGTGAYGVPGDGSPVSTNRFAPTTVKGIDNAVAVAATGNVSYAVLADGTIRAWGWNRMTANTLGALGTGTNIESTNVPLRVAGITNAVGVAAGAAAVLADGTVSAWGFGYGPSPKRGLPASNTPLPMEGIQSAVAISTYMALLRDGSIREFGAREWPWATPEWSNVVAIASDAVNRLALLADGKLMAWGHKRWYPNGPILHAELGAETARQCAARGLAGP